MDVSGLPLTERINPTQEILRCSRHPDYFIDRWCQIYEATGGRWIPFHLWPAQVDVINDLRGHRLTVLLKARQLGMSWIVIAWGLWHMLFRPAATVLVFSRRADEAMYLLGEERMRGMWRRLPEYLRRGLTTSESTLTSRRARNGTDAAMTFSLTNGSIARAFPTNAGDSYTASLAIVDEADLCPDLGKLMRSVKPTIDGGGRMILLSRSDKSKPESEFKKIYRASKAGSPWHAIFLPWTARPERTDTWYAAQKADILSRTGSLDDLHEQYPATDTEALSARTLDKRIPGIWIDQCYDERPAMQLPAGAPSIPGLDVYMLPIAGRQYVLCADPAEGNPTSDDSALEVIDLVTGEEVACLAGKFEPSVFAAHIDVIGRWFNYCAVLVERNNHGHAVLLWLQLNSLLTRLCGRDGREGWVTTGHSKADMWAHTADCFRERLVILHNFATRMQLGSIEGSSLEAPEGEHDDRAVAFGLCCAALMWGRIAGEEQYEAQEWDVIRT